MVFIDEMLDSDDLSDYVNSDHVCSAVSVEPIRNLDPKVPITLDENATINEAITLMQENKIGAILATDKGVLSGIFTERDILMKIINQDIDTQSLRLKDIMTPNPETLTTDDRVAYALNRMTVGGYRHIPIVDDETLTGIISVKDIVEFLVSLVEDEVYNIRPEPLKQGFESIDGG